MSINGRVVGDHRLDPGFSAYDRRVFQVKHDATSHLKRGANAVGVMLGNGWFNVQAGAPWNFAAAPWRASPRLWLRLDVEYADGTSETIFSDENWKASPGPIVFNTIYGGDDPGDRLSLEKRDRY